MVLVEGRKNLFDTIYVNVFK